MFLVIDVTDIEEEAILKNCPGVLKLNQKCKVVKKAKDGKSEAEENHQKIME